MSAAVLHLLRGFVMGSADVVPGVSGGTVALVFGIYERLIANISTGAAALGRLVRGDVRAARDELGSIEWWFIVPLLLGVALAVVSLASLIDAALEDHAEMMAGLFFGLVAASVVVAWRLIRRSTAIHVYIAVGVGVVVAILLGFQAGPAIDPPLLAYFGAGAIAICAMILPGVSGSFFLLTIGMYAAVIDVVDSRDLAPALVFAIGAVIGLAVFSTLLQRLLEDHHDVVMAVLVGLMLGSLRVLWPWPNGVGIVSEEADQAIDGTGIEWPDTADLWGPLLLAVGAAAVVLVVSHLALHRNPQS